MHTHFRAFLKTFYKNLSFHLFPLGREKLSGVFEKIFYFAKDPFTHLDKGCRNAHPFPGFFSKIFLRKNLPFTYLELQSQMTPYFSEKLKIFFVLLRDDLFLLTEEKVSSLIPTGKGPIPTLFQKYFV